MHEAPSTRVDLRHKPFHWKPVQRTSWPDLTLSFHLAGNLAVLHYRTGTLHQGPRLGRSKAVQIIVATPCTCHGGVKACPYLVDWSQRGPYRAGLESPPVVEHPARRPLPATVQYPAGGLLPVQGPCRGFVPAEFCASLPVPVRGAGLPGAAFLCWIGRQPLGYVLVVRRRSSFVWTAAVIYRIWQDYIIECSARWIRSGDQKLDTFGNGEWRGFLSQKCL